MRKLWPRDPKALIAFAARLAHAFDRRRRYQTPARASNASAGLGNAIEMP
jgi:hypothetical protein